MAKDKLHKDQKRLQAALLPVLIDKILSEGDPVAERDCTVVNRLLLQGPDPLYLMESAPNMFRQLCRSFDLTVEEGRTAIENAHWRGPATLFTDDATGLPDNGFPAGEACFGWRCEMLWLVLASCSDCTEEGYKPKMSLLERIQRASKATLAMAKLADTHPNHLEDRALESLSHFQDTTPVHIDADGRPHTNVDHGFYVLYKEGHSVVAVHYNEETAFWGTTQDTSLEAEGIKVDIEISKQFGIVKDGPTWEQISAEYHFQGVSSGV
jgi:hypothetical protein